MKRFKTKSRKFNRDIVILLIIILTSIFIHYYDYKISNKVLNIAKSRLEELTVMYIKKDIIPKDKDLNKLIIINKNKNDEIIYVDINYDYANQILQEVVGNIQNNINRIRKENQKELQSYNGNLYLKIPLYLYGNGTLLNNLGPKVVVKLSFYEYVLGTIDTEIEQYGINNVLLKVYLDVELNQKMIIPYQERLVKNNFRLILGTKLINGTVPDIYGGLLQNNSSIIKSQ